MSVSIQADWKQSRTGRGMSDPPLPLHPTLDEADADP